MGDPADLRALTRPDGTTLRYREWRAARPRGALLLTPGLGDHSGRYDRVARALVGEGIDVFAWDLRGHGLSEGQRGHVRRFGDYLQDLEAVRAAVAARLTDAQPLFLLGHSLGSLVSLRYVQSLPDAPVRGLVLSSPLLRLTVGPHGWRRSLARLLGRAVPRLPLPNGIDGEDLSRDPAVAEAYRSDPLVHGRITPRLYAEMTDAMRNAVRHPERLNVPTLMLVPLADPVVDPAGALEFARTAAGTAAIEVRQYPSARHEAFNDLEGERVVADVARWLLARTG